MNKEYIGQLKIGEQVHWKDYVDGRRRDGTVISIDPVFAVIEIDDNPELIQTIEGSLTQESMQRMFGDGDVMFFDADIICTDGKRYAIRVNDLFSERKGKDEVC